MPFISQIFRFEISTFKNTIQVDDEILVAEYRQSGDNKILGELFKRYVHLVFGVSMQYLKNEAEAQDMTMFVFEKLMSDLKIIR